MKMKFIVTIAANVNNGKGATRFIVKDVNGSNQVAVVALVVKNLEWVLEK